VFSVMAAVTTTQHRAMYDLVAGGLLKLSGRKNT
jgi:hypothetical protein